MTDNTTNKTKPTDKEINERLAEDVNREKFRVSYTYYIFLLCNFLVMLGVTISLIFTVNNNPDQDFHLPVIICNVISLAILVVFLYLESRTIIPYKYHINHKWYRFFLASMIIFGIILIVSTIIVYLPIVWNKYWSIGVLVGSMLISFVCMGLYRYARFHIDKDIYLRRHGVEVQKTLETEKAHEEERKRIDSLSREEFNKMKDKINDSSSSDHIGQQATSGLTEELEDDEN